MSYATKKGYTTVKVKGPRGDMHAVSIKHGSKLDRIARHRMKKAARAQKTKAREYKDRLRAAKKRYPIEERAYLRLEDI